MTRQSTHAIHPQFLDRSSPRAFSGKALTANFGDAKKAQEAADAAMLYLFPVQPAGGGAGAAQVNTIASDPRAVAIRDDKKLTLEQKKAKLRELGYQ